MAAELPPKKRNWTAGSPQIGVFLRTRMGSTIALVNNKASVRQETLVLALLLGGGAGAGKVPEEIMAPLEEWVSKQIKREKA